VESRTFIKLAGELITEIGDFKVAFLSVEDELAKGTSLQKQIANAFTGLQNPTLPSAGKLCAAALDAGFQVDPKVQQRIWQAEQVWS